MGLGAGGEALVERVRLSAAHHAMLCLEALANEISSWKVRSVALRQCPPLPPTVSARIRDYQAKNVADWVMYREALADAAKSRGWSVHWYDVKTVFDTACEALHVRGLDPHFQQARKSLGAPWNVDHKLAMAAALVALTVENP